MGLRVSVVNLSLAITTQRHREPLSTHREKQIRTSPSTSTRTTLFDSIEQEIINLRHRAGGMVIFPVARNRRFQTWRLITSLFQLGWRDSSLDD